MLQNTCTNDTLTLSWCDGWSRPSYTIDRTTWTSKKIRWNQVLQKG